MKLRILLIFTLLVSICTTGLSDDSSVIKDGEKVIWSTNVWLGMIDEEEYDASWNNASSQFQKSIDRSLWKNRIFQFRSKIGEIKYRSVSKIIYDEPKKSVYTCTVIFYTEYENQTFRC